MRTTGKLSGSGGWRLTVNRTVPSAPLSVLGNKTYAVRPGKQFFLINLTVAYSGKKPRAVFSGYDLYAIGRGGLVYTQLNDSCGVVRGALQDFRKVAHGSRISGNVCFWVVGADARALRLEYRLSSSRAKTFFELH